MHLEGPKGNATRWTRSTSEFCRGRPRHHYNAVSAVVVEGTGTRHASGVVFETMFGECVFITAVPIIKLLGESFHEYRRRQDVLWDVSTVC